MKQRITEKQLDELSKKGKEELRRKWKPEAGDLYIGGIERACYKADFDVVYPQSCYTTNEKYGKYLSEFKKECLPLLSIGQMIEFLVDNGKFYSIQRVDKKSKGWEIFMHKDDWRGFSIELVDVLWNSLKQELEE